MGMLVLSRKKNERIIIREDIVITVVDIRGDKVRIGIEAPKDISVHREEVQIAIDRIGAINGDRGSTIGKCECHERDSSYVCDYCHSQGLRGHMEGIEDGASQGGEATQ